ncbi:ABC transporter ATP-binding protein [Paenibacillus taichungensis]|uniref:ABC transporter ATP-binding protein n=1 Tax=Paenibacillus taichungensis TaxID=484184 RepID=UPI002DB721DD|nr:ABC transporter ATP-binding protein [Paenibacillus taichungensis]MEC0106176.1 ABC transporter ATP-binding protein [Paenibacillus taichungensis]MEC0199403.1 ABC transporter ATP-binding protein [Paenibacillus taichungensis]
MGNSITVLEVNNVSMKYRLATEKIDSMKHYFVKKIKGELKYEDFFALNDVSFSVNKGEVFGIIGRNGAGKSTLLKVISGILQPTSGEVNRKGTIAPLIELGAGFNGDLSGIENVYLNGMLMGYSRKFLNEHIEEILDFSEIESKFIHTPLKNYSSGMKARLGFSIATAVKPEILILDEVLSVGDFKFKEKSENKIKSMMREGTTVLFVSHSMTQMKDLCDRVLWLDRGGVREVGNSNEVCNVYLSNS